MKFYTKLPRKVKEYPCVRLEHDNWDDHGFRLTFRVWLVKPDRKEKKLGYVKIMRRGLESGPKTGRIDLPTSPFDVLPDGFASLGQTVDYYRNVSKLSESERDSLLVGLRDLATGKTDPEKFQNEKAFKWSLIRFSESEAALQKGKLIVYQKTFDGVDEPCFDFTLKLKRASCEHKVNVDFTKNEDLPHRINVWVGRNGTGKTKTLAALARSICEVSSEEKQSSFDPGRPTLTRVLTISYSAFDDFSLPAEAFPDTMGEVNEELVSYQYFGLRKTGSLRDPTVVLKEVFEGLEQVKQRGRNEKLKHFLRVVFTSNSQLETFVNGGAAASSVYAAMSAGQRIVVSIVVSVLGFLERGSLLFIDEPETHLHPGLLTSLISALHDLLSEYNSYAIIATHSPIICQQVPSSYIRVFRRVNQNIPLVQRLPQQSFGESLDVLVRQVLGLTDVERDYRSILKELVKKHGAAKVEKMFEQPLSFNARTFLRSVEVKE